MLHKLVSQKSAGGSLGKAKCQPPIFSRKQTSILNFLPVQGVSSSPKMLSSDQEGCLISRKRPANLDSLPNPASHVPTTPIPQLVADLSNDEASAPSDSAEMSQNKRRRQWSAEEKAQTVECIRAGKSIPVFQGRAPTRDVAIRWMNQVLHAEHTAIRDAAHSEGGCVTVIPENVLRCKRGEASGRRLPNEVSQAILLRVMHLRSLGISVTQARLSRIAQETAESANTMKDLSWFHASDKWVKTFMEQNNLSRRRSARASNCPKRDEAPLPSAACICCFKIQCSSTTLFPR